MGFFRLILIFPALLLNGRMMGQSCAETVLKQMHERHKGGMCRNYTFSQRNVHYQNDTVIGESVWHESVGLPDRFRIVFGDSVKGNSVLFRNDSVFHYRRGQLTKSSRDSNSLLLLLGGMYYRDLEDVRSRLTKAGFDLGKCSEQSWQGTPVWVIGAEKGDDASNQVWIEKKDLKVVRIIEKLNENDTMDMRFESHRRWCKGFVEDRVSFRRNGRLEQVEEYFDLRERERFME